VHLATHELAAKTQRFGDVSSIGIDHELETIDEQEAPLDRVAAEPATSEPSPKRLPQERSTDRGFVERLGLIGCEKSLGLRDE
jgi:hypothetical protein